MSRNFPSYGVEALRIPASLRASVYSGGQDIRLTWQIVAPFGGGFGEAPYELAAYGAATDPQLFGAVVEVWFGRTGTGTAPFVLARSVRVTDQDYVYRETDNRADASRYGLPFQAQVRFVVRPWTSRGTGVSASLLTASSSVPFQDGVVRNLDDLGDVVAGVPDDGDVLTYDAGTDTWIPAAPSGGPGGGITLDDAVAAVEFWG